MRYCGFTLAGLVLLAAIPAFGQDAQPVSGAEQNFVSRFLKTCFETNFDYDTVASEAAAKGWTEIDTSAVPLRITDKSGKAIAHFTAWRTTDKPAPFMVYAVKYNDPKFKSRCNIAGFDLDGDVVVQLLIEDGRFKNTLGIPLHGGGFLHFDNGNIVVNTGSPSKEEQAAGHASETYIQGL
jgi:hypothetical protein